jgi:excisionase family DNA binding protein
MTDTTNASTLPAYATKQQVADWLQVSPQTVERLVKRGQLPYKKLGRLIRFPGSLVRVALERPAQ